MIDPRVEIVLGRRILYREGCDSNVGGQVTVRSADGDGFWATGFSYFDQGGPDDVAKLGWDLEVLEGTFPLAAAMGAHRAVYQRRPDVGAVVHIHSPHVVAVASTGQVVGNYDITAVCFAGEQALYADDGVKPHSSVAKALGDGRVVLMQNHGALIASDTLPHAVIEAITLERCARIHLLALPTNAREIHPTELAAGRNTFRPHYLTQMWTSNVARTLSP